METTDIDEFVVISNHKFAQHFEDWKNNKKKVRPYEITVIDDGTSTNERRLGAVKDIQLAVEMLNISDDLLVMAGDNVLDFSLSAFVDEKDEAIVSREVFNAANHLRASRNYSKKNRPLPVLSVVEDGILRGYVPFDKDWTGFSAEEYREASESVMKEPDVTVTADVKKRLDLTGYEIVRVQYFSTMQNPAMTISNGRLRFNTACLKKFENVEYVELLLNSVERCIAIRPCDKNNPNAIRWGRLKEGRWCASTLGCRGLAKTLFDIMEWDEDLRYRFRGQFLEQGDNKMMLFAFDEPEMIKVEEIVLPPKENTEEDEGETVKKKIYIFPPEWAGTFGQPITSIAQVGILRQEHYAGNWDVFRPATEIEEMNIFTAESLNELLREAEKIMEGWTDYR